MGQLADESKARISLHVQVNTCKVWRFSLEHSHPFKNVI